MDERAQGLDAPTVTIVAALLLSGYLGGFVSGYLDSLFYETQVRLAGVSPTATGDRAAMAWITFLAVDTLVGAVLLRLLLRLLAGLDLSVPAALITQVVGYAPGVVLNVLFHPSGGGSVFLPGLSPLSVVSIAASLAVQVLLVRSLARSPSPPPAPFAPGGTPPWELLRKNRRLR